MQNNGQSKRCAIYTRKSSEEGLEQSFNSLDAQREACEAFAKSQAHEGWIVLPDLYDDGGFSGGNMERPALARLMRDIEAGNVDAVIVYKVDRLSRSLADFVRMIERFDQKGISFVSVTQQFNTSTSMGRLTLNVLLSFAQFEREVTSERIRDKIAASKKKGMWMGGVVPLGYDRVDKQLVVNEDEAIVVRHICTRYLALGCVRSLKAELDTDGYRSKARVAESKIEGNKPFSRGALYTILKNPVYIGKVHHKGELHDGKHAAIVQKDIWDAVQALLTRNRRDKQVKSNTKHPSLLSGLVFDDQGNRMSPTYTRKNNRHYGYYISQALLQYRDDETGTVARVPSSELEGLVLTELFELLESPQRLLDLSNSDNLPANEIDKLIKNGKMFAKDWNSLGINKKISVLQRVINKVEVSKTEIKIQIRSTSLVSQLLEQDSEDQDREFDQRTLTLSTQAVLKRTGIETKLVYADKKPEIVHTRSADALQKTLLKALQWNESLLSGEADSINILAEQEDISPSYIRAQRHLAFISIDEMDMVANPEAQSGLYLKKRNSNLPLLWNKQPV
jgi:site-specific DNA recombinase